MATRTYLIDPQAKVRMTQRDKWGGNVRPAVAKWRAFKDRVRELGVVVAEGDSYLFEIAMPPSWSAKKRAAMRGQPHRQKPDLDNLVGGTWDAACPDGDAHISWIGNACKRWSDEGRITIENNSSQGP